MKKLEGRNVIVYDLEIEKEIEKCSDGWNSKDEMGISVGIAFDYLDMRYRCFLKDNIQELVDRLNIKNTLVVAFNHIGFDNELLRAQGYNLKPDSEIKNYDMLLESRIAVFGKNEFVSGFKLDEHLKALKLPIKTGDGALAPVWWQEKKFGKVIDYCLNDVKVEKMLFEYIMEHGLLACAHKKEKYKVRIPEII